MLDIHAADDIERLAVYRNVHDVWGRGLPLDEHVQRRLSSPQHKRAKWFVGCTEGRVATSLGVYELAFRYLGEIVPGMAIGAVHTHADFRGRGFAAELIRWVETECRRNLGTAVSLLYSDIPPAYYARLGYVECPSWMLNLHRDAFPSAPDAGGCDWRAVPVGDAVAVMQECYDRFHRDRAISIHRPLEYWEFLVRKSPADEVFVLGSPAGADGYCRIRRADSTVVLRDFALRTADDQSHLRSAILQLARQTGAVRISGWVPRHSGGFSELAVARRDEITMLKSLSPDVQIDETVLAAADWFQEIDHV